MDKKPFTDEEQKVMELLVEAHNEFIRLPQTHPMEIQEWVISFHRLQDLLGARILRRDYPETFITYPDKTEETENLCSKHS